MDATIPDRGWYQRRGPLVHSYIEDRGKTCARNSLPLCMWEYQKQQKRRLVKSLHPQLGSSHLCNKLPLMTVRRMRRVRISHQILLGTNKRQTPLR